ncbi:NAD(P)H-dependent oxidoreductase [Sulfurimonas diazotrophicus]|uniref:NAD(P)H-dependent oxidoreductase n=1 Tax=Sulfurimonas diazotrophicus TaxID=3131939 RepID=A0ABZ3HC63_9BACT
MHMKAHYLDILQFRHAARRFHEHKAIAADELDYILEAGRLSPSSFGIEPWQFLVVTSDPLKRQLQSCCYGQEQVGTASAVIVILARKTLRIEDGYVEPLLRRDGDDLYENVLKGFYAGYTDALSPGQLGDYADKQCYLAAMNLMNAAAALGIDSCPLGGFDAEAVMSLLRVDTATFGVSMVLPMGYGTSRPEHRHRRAFDDVVTFVD